MHLRAARLRAAGVAAPGANHQKHGKDVAATGPAATGDVMATQHASNPAAPACTSQDWQCTAATSSTEKPRNLRQCAACYHRQLQAEEELACCPAVMSWIVAQRRWGSSTCSSGQQLAHETGRQALMFMSYDSCVVACNTFALPQKQVDSLPAWRLTCLHPTQLASAS